MAMPARLADVLLQAEEAYGATILRTEHELRNVPWLQELCQVSYAVGGGGCTGLASEECVVAYKDQVVWTSGRSVRKRFTASSDVLQVCWAHFGSQSSSAPHKGVDRNVSSGGGTGGPQTSRRSSIGTATDTNVLQQRTVSLATWRDSAQGAAGASTPEHQGLLSTAAGAGAAGAGGADATGWSPGHLPNWWTSNTSAQSAGASRLSVLQGSTDARAAAAGNKLQNKVSTGQHKQQAALLQDAAATPAGSLGVGKGGKAAPIAGMVPGSSSSAASASDGSDSGSRSSACDAVLCLLLRNSITCIFPSGELLECPLLQPCQALWPMPTGVILAGPSEAFASVLTHPLEEPLPVVADCSLSTANTAEQLHVSTPAAYAGWSQERVVWSSRELPFVATHNEDRGRLSIWHIRPQPPGTSTIGSAYDLPALSPFGLGPMRTPVAASAAGASSSLPTFGSVNHAGTATAAGHTAVLGSGGSYGSAAAAAAATGYVGGPAAYSGSMLGMVASGGVSPWSGPGSFARLSVGVSTVKRSSLRSPAGRLPASIFSPTPNPQNPITGALGALGPLRPAFSNTTAAQQALLLPGPDPSVMFKLIWRQGLAGGLVPDSAVQATDATGLPLLCVLCHAAQQLLAFQLPGDVDSSNLVVKPAFSTAALAAVPVSTGLYATQNADSSSGGGGSSGKGIRTRQVVDLLILQPGGKLILHRGPSALVMVRLLVPYGHLQYLQHKLEAAAAVRQQHQQQLQLQGSPMFGAAGSGLLGGRAHDGALGTTASAQGPPASGQAPAASICSLGGASGDRFDVHLQLGTSQVPLRVRLGVSWLPGLPSQVLQALTDVLDTPCSSRLLAACLTHPGACCGELYTEWRAIAAVLLAWALQPDCLDLTTGSSSSSIGAAQAGKQGAQQQQQSGVLLQPQQQQQQQVHGSESPVTPRSNAAATDACGSQDMDMATPAGPTAAGKAASTPQQQQQQTPGSEMAMSVDMSADTASAATPATQRRLGRYQQAASGTPMSISNTPVSVTSKAVSRLRHQSSYRQDHRQHQRQQQQQLLFSGLNAEDVFPTASTPAQAAAATATEITAAEAAAVAAAQQSFGQLQLPQTPQHPAAAAADPEEAWQQLLQSTDSNQLLQQLPGLQVSGQAATKYVEEAAAAQQAVGSSFQQQHQMLVVGSQQQQQHRRDVGLVLLALHSVYQDCKLSRLRLHLLQLLGPVCWLLATWLDAPLYREHYERESTTDEVTAAAQGYSSAAQQLLASVGLSSSSGRGGGDSSTGRDCLWEPQRHLAASEGVTAAQQQQQGEEQGVEVDQLLQQSPGDILRCLSLLLSASQQYQQYTPHLASKGSLAVLKSLQLLQAYTVLAGSASKCAAAVAAAVSSSVSDGSAQQVGLAVDWLGDYSSSKQAALVCELQHVLLQCSQHLVLLLVDQGWDVLALNQLPVGVALPIKEALTRCRSNPPVGWPIMAYALIGREDIAATLASNSNSSSSRAVTCTAGVLISAKTTGKQDQQQQQFLPGVTIRVQQQAQQVQHVLLPYEQRLLLPSGSFLTGQQHHQRLVPSAGAGNAAATANPRICTSRGPAPRGMRSTGSAGGGSGSGIAASAAAGGSNGAAASRNGSRQGGEVVPVDGMEGLVNGVSALRFGRDDRLAEARSLLGTNMPVLLVPAASESDPELPAKQQASLFAAAMRTMALPLGRGALTLGMAEPLPGEHVVVPLLCLSGVVPCPTGENGTSNGRVLVNLDLTTAQPATGGGAAAEITAWCEFHNGVAAGLKIAPYHSRRNKQRQLQQQQQQQQPEDAPGSSGSMASSRDDSSGSESLLDTWLPHSKPAVPNYAHAGVLLALGLNGHLDRLSWTDLYRYLSDQHDATTIAVLLGMSASCRGTADSTVARMLFLHLPARHPNNFPEIELSPHVQAASLLGVGLLYQGSCHRLMTETVLEEMCRTPGINPNAAAAAATGGGQDGAGAAGASLSALMSVTHDREGYALAAGFSLGLICLGQGRNAPGLADLHLEDRLRNLMDAQVQPHSVSHKPTANKPPTDKPNSSSSYSSAGSSGTSARNLLDQVLGPGVVPWSVEAGDDPTGLAAAAAGAGGAFKVDSDQMQQYGISQVVLEGPVVNTAVTGPAAAMALMMMYLKTGDADVAARFKVPGTAYALDHMRPDMVQLMALGRALVMWETIEPTEQWLRGQLTPLLDHPLQTILSNQASPPAAAASGGAGSTAAGAAAGRAGRQQQASLDWGAVGLAHVNAMAGTCFALGLRFAGTCSAQAEFLLRGQLLALLQAKRRAPSGSNSSAVAAATAAAAAGVASGASVAVAHLPPSAACVGQLDKAALENAIVTVLLSLSMVMAGSGHLPTFRLIQMLSRRAAAPLRPPSQVTAQGPDGQPGCFITAVLGGAGVGTNSLHYGHHLAVSLAGGLLFLSGGRSSLSTSNEAVAALLIALYPVWPCTPTDQRCHLQAFRHLFALAAEPRCLEALDVHSRRQVVVPLSVAALTEGLAGAAAAAQNRQQQQRLQQQQQRQSVLKQWLQPTATVGETGMAGPAAAAGLQQLPPPAFSTGASCAAGGGEAGARPRAGLAITPPLKPGLPPLSPTADAAAPSAATAAGGGTASAAAAAGSSEVDSVRLRLQAPCLLPERHHLVSLRVCGPRYWAVQLAAGRPSSSSSSGSWSQQYLQHRICVKKKAGSLSYTDDHTGVKSLLFKAFYAGGTDSILAAAATADAAAEAAAVDVEGHGDQTQAADGRTQQQAQHSFDITHLCQTFATDPQIQAFAQVLQAASTAAAAVGLQGPAHNSSSRFLSFCSGALYECVVQEKTGSLTAYLQLYALTHRVCSLVDAAATGMPMQQHKPWGSSGHCSYTAVLGCAPPAGYGLLLQDLTMALSYYSSSIAVAAGMCRTAMHTGPAVGGSDSSMQQQQQVVDMLMWQPLLQPGFCNSLITTLMQFWRAANMLPATPPSSSSISSGADDEVSMVSKYIAAGSISAAAAAAAESAGRGDAQQQRKGQRLLAGCLAALQLPAAVQLQGLKAALLRQQQQQQGRKPDIAAVLQLLSGPGGGSLGQEVPPGSLVVLAAALQAAL